MTTITANKIEVCDFCHEESPMGCTGVGPKTEIGVIEVMSICPRCRLSSLHSSIKKSKKEISEYKERDMLLEDYEWENYYETREFLEESIMDLHYLVKQTIEHYSALYPNLIQPLNAEIDGAASSGIYIQLDQADRVMVQLFEHDGVPMHLHSIVAVFTRDLGLTSYSVVHPIANIGAPLNCDAFDIVSIGNAEGGSAC
ncbi:hypothetical protein [Paenibacillus taichungensis]